VYRQPAGEDIFQALHDRLALPLHRQDFQRFSGWHFYEAMSEHPAYHFGMSPRDEAQTLDPDAGLEKEAHGGEHGVKSRLRD
jgi:hypothetical protein